MEVQQPVCHRVYFERWGADTVVISAHILARPNLDGETKSQIADDIEKALNKGIKALRLPKPELKRDQFTISGHVFELSDDRLHLIHVKTGDLYSVADGLFVRNNELHVKHPVRVSHPRTEAYLRGASKRVQESPEED